MEYLGPKLPTVLYAQISIPSLSEIAQSILAPAPFVTVDAAISHLVMCCMTPDIVTYMVTACTESGTMGKHAIAVSLHHVGPYDSDR